MARCKRYLVFFLWLFVAVMLVSCDSPPADAPPVDYGATLGEWEAAVGAETAAEAANDGVAETAETDVAPTTENDTAVSETNNNTASTTSNGTNYQEIMWDALVPAGYTPADIMEKYADELAEFEDGSPGADELYSQMMEEFNNAPVNETLDQTYVKIPGFIAPLEYSGELITEFLLVPYFGACIHVPPPPVNQTVLVKTAEGQGIDPIDSFDPIWVIGMITAEGNVTVLANAGYSVENAMIEPYTGP